MDKVEGMENVLQTRANLQLTLLGKLLVERVDEIHHQEDVLSINTRVQVFEDCWMPQCL